MTDRIRAQHGNVIVGDFRPRASLEAPFSIKVIYADGTATLFRCQIGDCTWHILADASNHRIVTTN